MEEHCQRCPVFLKECQAVSQKRTNNHAPEGSLTKKSRQSESVADNSFLNKAPRPERWCEKQLSIVGTPQNYQNAIRSLWTQNTVQEKSPSASYSGNLIDIGSQLATVTQSSFQSAKLQKCLANFHALILLSYLALLESLGESIEATDSIIRSVQVFGTMNSRRLISGGKKANRLIQKLAGVGWSLCRATELFFLCKFSGLIMNETHFHFRSN